MSEVIPHWLTKRAHLTPNQIAIETKTKEQMTFFQLKKESKQFARKLANHGIKKGTHVGIYFNNSVSMVVAIHALSYLDTVAVLLNTRLTARELIYQLEDASISLLLTSDLLHNQASEIAFHIPLKSFSEINQLSPTDVTLQEEFALDDIFTIMYTSGTTGHPKGVIHTYGNHWWSAMGSALNLGLQQTDKWLAVLPLFHIGGLSILIRSVIYGIPVYLLEKFSEKNVQDAIIKHNVTIASVVTVMLQRIINDLGPKSYPESFRCMLLGGGPVPISLLKKSQYKNIPVFQSYGLTETASQIVTLSPSDALKKHGSAGKSLFPGQLEIRQRDSDGVGEIFVKGPMVTSGYLRQTEKTDESIYDGWLATGDLGYLDDEGFLYVIDRRSDLIISGGENIYPSEIESALLGLDEIKEIGVIGKKDTLWGEIPVAFVVLNNHKITEQEIISYARSLLARYKLPKNIYFVNQLPRTATNKLSRIELKKWLDSGKYS